MSQANLTDWVVYFFIGGVIGWLAGLIVRGRGFGIFGDIAIGIVGSLLGGLLSRVVGLTPDKTIGAFLLALAGAVILVGVTRFVKRVA